MLHAGTPSDDGGTAPAPFTSIAIVGFGLIGASLALAVKQRSAQIRVTAIDRSEVVDLPLVRGMVDACVSSSAPAEVRAQLERAELTVLAMPVRVIEEQIPQLLEHAQLVTDCGSSKRAIVARALQARRFDHFVPGHPMAGRPRGGAESALPDLFEDRSWILCPGVASPEAFKRVRELVTWVGAKCVELEPESHDLAVAVTSHVPQLYASLLAVMAHEAGAEGAAGPGFQSATRVAGGNITMWRDIFISNADAIARVSRQLSDRLRVVSDELAEGRVDSAIAILERARELRSK